MFSSFINKIKDATKDDAKEKEKQEREAKAFESMFENTFLPPPKQSENGDAASSSSSFAPPTSATTPAPSPAPKKAVRPPPAAAIPPHLRKPSIDAGGTAAANPPPTAVTTAETTSPPLGSAGSAADHPKEVVLAAVNGEKGKEENKEARQEKEEAAEGQPSSATQTAVAAAAREAHVDTNTNINTSDVPPPPKQAPTRPTIVVPVASADHPTVVVTAAPPTAHPTAAVAVAADRLTLAAIVAGSPPEAIPSPLVPSSPTSGAALTPLSPQSPAPATAAVLSTTPSDRYRHRLLDFFQRYDPMKKFSPEAVDELVDSEKGVPEHLFFARLLRNYGLSQAASPSSNIVGDGLIDNEAVNGGGGVQVGVGGNTLGNGGETASPMGVRRGEGGTDTIVEASPTILRPRGIGLAPDARFEDDEFRDRGEEDAAVGEEEKRQRSNRDSLVLMSAASLTAVTAPLAQDDNDSNVNKDNNHHHTATANISKFIVKRKNSVAAAAAAGSPSSSLSAGVEHHHHHHHHHAPSPSSQHGTTSLSASPMAAGPSSPSPLDHTRAAVGDGADGVAASCAGVHGSASPMGGRPPAATQEQHCGFSNGINKNLMMAVREKPDGEGGEGGDHEASQHAHQHQTQQQHEWLPEYDAIAAPFMPSVAFQPKSWNSNNQTATNPSINKYIVHDVYDDDEDAATGVNTEKLGAAGGANGEGSFPLNSKTTNRKANNPLSSLPRYHQGQRIIFGGLHMLVDHHNMLVGPDMRALPTLDAQNPMHWCAVEGVVRQSEAEAALVKSIKQQEQEHHHDHPHNQKGQRGEKEKEGEQNNNGEQPSPFASSFSISRLRDGLGHLPSVGNGYGPYYHPQRRHGTAECTANHHTHARDDGGFDYDEAIGRIVARRRDLLVERAEQRLMRAALLQPSYEAHHDQYHHAADSASDTRSETSSVLLHHAVPSAAAGHVATAAEGEGGGGVDGGWESDSLLSVVSELSDLATIDDVELFKFLQQPRLIAATHTTGTAAVGTAAAAAAAAHTHPMPSSNAMATTAAAAALPPPAAPLPLTYLQLSRLAAEQRAERASHRALIAVINRPKARAQLLQSQREQRELKEQQQKQQMIIHAQQQQQQHQLPQGIHSNTSSALSTLHLAPTMPAAATATTTKGYANFTIVDDLLLGLDDSFASGSTACRSVQSPLELCENDTAAEAGEGVVDGSEGQKEAAAVGAAAKKNANTNKMAVAARNLKGELEDREGDEE